MSLAFSLLAALIVATPLVALIEGPVVQGIVAVLTAAVLATTAWSAPPGEARFLSRVLRPAAIGLALPAIWMAMQAVPSPLDVLSNPIWASVQGALGERNEGAISIDPGITLVALARYLANAAVVIGAAAAAVDRRRAEMLLFALAAAPVLAAIMLFVHGFTALPFVGEAGDRASARSWVAECALGAPIAAAAFGHLWERFERAAGKAGATRYRFAALACCVGGLAICFLALFFAASAQLFLIAVCGLAIIAAVTLIRRLNVSPWLSAASAIVALVAFAAAISLHADPRADLTLRYADAPAGTVAPAERMLADGAWAGSGGGVFAALLPIYSDVDDVAQGDSAPTAAAGVAIELGKPALWIVVAMAVLAVGLLLRGAFARGRDSMYPLAAASSTFVFALAAFATSSVFATPVALLAAATLGLGIAQSVSRSAIA